MLQQIKLRVDTLCDRDVDLENYVTARLEAQRSSRAFSEISGKLDGQQKYAEGLERDVIMLELKLKVLEACCSTERRIDDFVSQTSRSQL
ncbi:hypothetical protein PPTG_24797 [Phytophthora nicotianae INRA-310]|uniref:Uncharacterized protein n=1 Tax=Phytophthora nicotianae (strain INRA-310) TaxID=761204 RepID=W2PCD9_PHYN3|nr:hypothetical protein PPTG_24797 [Phytophthora nicotianae INRA-310]ETM97878.1 hypothetical protein PPTG_24797 [Phytophthora nicotianae INRA-310]